MGSHTSYQVSELHKAPAAAIATSSYRWRICALLFFATTVNYIDRQVLGVLAPELQRVIGWNEIQYGNIVAAFQAAYALGLLGAGRLMDRIGTRLGYTFAIGVWSIATMGHALVQTVLGFGFARFFLGLGESGNFPAAIKTVAEWFPKRERALATGIFNAGTNIGATVAPIVVPWLTVKYGWQSAFIATGALGALWIIPWLLMYRPPEKHPGVSASELALIRSDPPDPETRVPWLRLFPHRQMWAFAIGKFLTDPIWWFLLFWLPKFLNTQYGLTLTQLGWPLVIIYNAATVGSIGGGWLPAKLIKMGWTVNRARKTSMLVCALGMVPIIFATHAANLTVAVALISLAVAAHQGWSCNLFTLASDMFPRRAVGSAVGIGGFVGAIGGMLIATVTGFVLELTHSYVSVFMIAGFAYLVALLVIQLLAPRLEPAQVDV
ncbi:MAG TPA: MFS transporter [Bryobacteraceae bacterium]|nr:MFS transporter [Bryobacteraceae bacterium]